MGVARIVAAIFLALIGLGIGYVGLAMTALRCFDACPEAGSAAETGSTIGIGVLFVLSAAFFVGAVVLLSRTRPQAPRP